MVLKADIRAIRSWHCSQGFVTCRPSFEHNEANRAEWIKPLYDYFYSRPDIIRSGFQHVGISSALTS